MTKRLLIVLSVMIICGAQCAFAASSTALPECSRIASACEAQGYLAGAHHKNGKGLWVDCIGAIAKGRAVTGVTGFTADEAKACEKAAKASQQANKASKVPATAAGK